MIILALIVLAGFGLFYLILQADVPGLVKFLLVFLEMTLISQYFIKKYGFSSELGLVLLKSKKGIELINRLAAHEKAFNFMADLGCAISYGLLSLVLMRKRVSLPVLALGMVLLGLLSMVVAPFALSFLFQVIKVGSVDSTTMNTLTSKAELGAMAGIAILLFGGFFLFVLAGVMLYGAIVVNAVVGTLFFGADTLAKTSAGGTFLLPGINLPLFEGILALVVVLVVHEGAHAVLTRIAKVPLKSSGLVLFGVIPIGAFVEPDEKRLLHADAARQTRVLVGGPTANLLTSLLFCAIFLAFVFTVNTLVLGSTPLAPVLKFVYTTLGLAFSLNFVVGVVNLMPIPLFDGYRVIDVNVKNKMLVKAISYTALLFFILNFLPLIFH